MHLEVLATMARLVLCVLALLVAGGFAEPAHKVLPQKTADPAFLQRQVDVTYLFYHIHEPTFIQEQKTIASTWSIEKNIEKFNNVTAVKIYVDLWGIGLLPRSAPFSVLNDEHRFEAVTMFNVLWSAKDYETFYKTAVYLREWVNEQLYVYVLSTVILHRHDTQGLYIPPVYEILPSFFNNGEIMTTAQRINTHGKQWVDHFPSTFLWNDNIVIRWNETTWPYTSEDLSLAYFTQDHELNTYYYNWHLTYPFWLGAETCPLVKDNRGEWFWFVHKQLLARYYMERLSNGLGEIPELGLDVVQTGYTSGLLYHNGIPFPSRPNHFHLDQQHFVDDLIKITDYERRIRDAIDRGYVIDTNGEKVNIRTPEAIDVFARVVEANVDSPNNNYYKDFISLWKIVLGNSEIHDHVVFRNNQVPLVLPSILEHYQTALRDPAFYMIWKRVLNLFKLWQESLPFYRPEELALPSVSIEDVDVDKLVTYFEYTYVNVTNHLHLNENERTTVSNEYSVLVQRPQMNHKVFQVRVNVKSDSAKKVLVRFFLAPKYDGQGYEIPLHQNTENFYLLDQFVYDLPEGKTVIKRDSTENVWLIDEWLSNGEILEKSQNALRGKGQFILDQSHRWNGLPNRFLLPKGRIGGMPFVFVAYITEYLPPKVAYGTGFDQITSIGIGSGATRMTSQPLGYPFNRPLFYWQVKDLKNFHFEDVTIFHKHTPEIDVPYTE